ncbi:tetratricopeptide repeat protein [Methanosarcina sp.]|uniref:tetratricopeptide repeat protein n=1 Tax=Methanosarcina sp. TaxID=2213 RepID=UPI002AB9DAAA|nr:tetratricopeptide repeat protein [Methanosarcina sp.]MDY9925539.1 tetratricopeptide repeat protein [Methanosarcina sp.]
MSVEAKENCANESYTFALCVKAQFYNKQGEELKARKAFQKFISIESNRYFKKSLKIYDERIKNSQNSSLYYEKALVLDELKRYKEAIEALDEFLKNKPRDAKAWLKKGTILFKLAKNEGTKTTCKESKTENKKEKSACEKEITRIEATRNALEKSIGYFKILIDENPGNPDHWYNRGTAHSSLAEVLIKTGEYQDSLNEYEEAVKAFDNATTLNPDFALAWNNKGNAYLKLKKHNKAVEAFEKAFEINPNYYLALHNKGDALYFFGKYDEAIKIYEQVIKQGNDKSINTVSYKSHNNKGLAYYKLGEYNKAKEAFNKATEINPTFADALTNRGLVFYKMEMFSKAKKAFEEALELDLGNPRSSNNLAVVLAREGELDRAKGILENILEENPDFILGSANLAELYLNSGGIERASEKINSILKDDKNPDSSMGYVHFLDGRIKIEDRESKEKKYSEAAKSFEKAASFNVEDPKSLLWLVYAKYLCQKFEVDRKTGSSEVLNSGKESVSPKAEDLCSNELSNSIVSDLGKILNFCNTPAVKRSSLPGLLNQNRLRELILTLTLLYGLFYLFDTFEIFERLDLNVQTIPNIQILHYTYLIAIGLILLVILFERKLTWPIIVIITLILLFGSFSFKSLVLSFGLLTATLLIILLKLLDRSPGWLVPVTIVTILITGSYSLALSALIIVTIILLILLYRIFDNFRELIDGLVDNLKIVKAKQFLIKFNRHKEIEAYTLYLLGYFYFRLQDYTTAREKLQESINLRPDARTDKAARELLDNIWKHKIKPPFWTYWFNSPVNTWRRRAFGTFLTLGILLILFVHAENPQPVAWNETKSDDLGSFTPDQINFYPYIVSYNPANNTTSGPIPPENNSTAWNILTPTRLNIYPDIPDNYFDAVLLLILILILISPSVRIAENVKLILKKGGDVGLDLGPIAAPPEFNFELSPSLMQDVIKRLDENL